MTSQLNVDTIVDKAGTGGTTLTTPTLTGMASASTYTSEGGAKTQNTVQGLAKNWSQFNGSGTVSIRASFNQSSLTDSGTGSYRVNYTNSMSGTAFATPSAATARDNGSTYALSMNADYYTPKTTGYSHFLFLGRSSYLGDSFADTADYDMATFGDLA
tara:strand:- start:54 stop:527 length:474 start_codon:yes stop_codon:yes gene_type:complete